MKNKEKLYSAALASVVVILVLIILSSTALASTLNVGNAEKHKTIQSAVNMAKDGDTIKVASGTYKENVRIDKPLTILGTKYPKVDGFYYDDTTGTIDGFSIQKNGIVGNYAGGNGIIRNNYFYNCDISLMGWSSSSAIIMNNQLKNGTIALQDNSGITVTGNTISNSKYGLVVGDMAGIPTVSKNTFKNCNTAVFLGGYSDPENPGQLTTFTDNKYINNKVNIGWGTKGL